MAKEKINISKEEATKVADEIIKQRLSSIAGNDDIIEMSDGSSKKGEGDGQKIESPIDKESANILNNMDNKGSLGLSEFDTALSSDKPIEAEENIEIASKIELDKMIEEDEEGEDSKIDNKTAYSDRDGEPVVDMVKTFEEKMLDAGMSKDLAIDMILQLADTGHVEEQISLFGGRIVCKVKSPKMIDSAKFIDMLDEEEMNTPAKVEFYLNLYSMSAILIKYGDTDLSELSMRQRTKWIEEHIPTVMYKSLLPRIQKFHLKIELLSSDEVANFF